MDTTDVSFQRDIKPLFRDEDRERMQFAFDLWAYEDVRTHAQVILDRLDNGSMPCDGPWPEDKVATLRRWIASGMPR
jgi:hypothetical protein